jgi:hypothetical protein
MSIQLRDGFQGQPLERVLEDVLVRFVLFAQPPEDEPEVCFDPLVFVDIIANI